MDVRRIVDEMAREPQPPGGIDLGAAVRAGKRRLLWRRAVAGGGAMAALVAGVMVWPAAEAERMTPAGPSAPTGFDPMVRHLEFGWVPDGLSARGVDNGTRHAAITAGPRPRDERVFEAPTLAVVFGARGAAIDDAGPRIGVPGGDGRGNCPMNDKITEPAPQVGGRPAVWRSLQAPMTGCRPVVRELRWEYAPGAWAAVRLERTPEGTDRKDAMMRVARSVRSGLNAPLRLPFRLAEPLTPARLTTGQAKPNWNVHVEYSGQRTCSVGARPSAYRDRHGEVGPADTTFDGRPARRTGPELTVFGMKGLDVSVACATDTDRTMRSISVPEQRWKDWSAG
ncbi:hypothetical protein ACFQU9_41145 [Actinomadura namibiensis]|uniref:Uncharacterized protein n=1 Tax=Actinomadura namibiensis TaxID=182080 RepID=A0A7W3QKJ9_ACTNM|nr:hypothetical protein [Actinomadura namibiensis]MBA8950609.1 hypothetical protein [Actinomadura namibiensis]